MYRTRPATEADSDLAFDILKSALGPYIDQQYGWNEDEQRCIHDRRFNPDLTTFIVQDSAEVGLISVDRRPDHIQLRQLFVKEHAQGKGIGSFILKELMSEADRGRVPIKLGVMKVNRRALDFYVRHGFIVCGETETHHLVEYHPLRT